MKRRSLALAAILVMLATSVHAIQVSGGGTSGGSSGGSSFDSTADYSLTGAVTHSVKQLTVNGTAFYLTNGAYGIYDSTVQNFWTVIGAGNSANYVYFRSPASNDYGGMAFGSHPTNPSSYLRYVHANLGQLGPGYYWTGVVKDMMLDAGGLCIGCTRSSATVTVNGPAVFQGTMSVYGIEVGTFTASSSATFVNPNTGQGLLTPPSFSAPTSSPATGSFLAASTTNARGNTEFVWIKPACDQNGNCSFTINLASYTNITGPLNITSTSTLFGPGQTITVSTASKLVTNSSYYMWLAFPTDMNNSSITTTSPWPNKPYLDGVNSGTATINAVWYEAWVPSDWFSGSTMSLLGMTVRSSGTVIQQQAFLVSAGTASASNTSTATVCVSTIVYVVPSSPNLGATGGEVSATTEIPFNGLTQYLAPKVHILFRVARDGDNNSSDPANSFSAPTALLLGMWKRNL